MEIKLRGLKQGEHSFFVSEPVKKYELDNEHFSENLDSSILIDVQGRNYYITVTTSTKVKFACDRCLDDFIRSYKVSTKLIYTENPSLDPEHQQEDLYFLPAGKDTADLTDDIRQNIILNLPMKVVCKDTCKGLCITCGVNLNMAKCKCSHKLIDHRWDALKKLQME